MAAARLLHRQLNGRPPLAVGGEGCFIIDNLGKRYLDASGGAAVSCLGHGHQGVAQAMKAQIDKLAYAHTSFFSTEVAEELAQRLVEDAPSDFERAFFVSGGSEAVEAAIKLARQYFVEIGRPERHVIISRRQSYHGNTIGALSVSGHAKRREVYEPYLFRSPKIAPCYAYRERRLDETEEQYAIRAADDLEAEILRTGPELVAAFIAETVSGATLGAQPASAGYFQRIGEICRKYDVLLILDEVMSGMGRTGTLHAFEQEAVEPDIICCAKGLGGGYQPIGAVIARARVVDALVDGSGMLRHGHTYMAHPVACAAALAVQNAIRDDNLLENVRTRGTQLTDILSQRFGQHANVGDVRGRGLLVGLELVQNRATKDPFDPSLRLAERIKAIAQRCGLICYPGTGTADGTRGDHVLLAPPYTIDSAGIELIADALSTTFERVFSEASVDAALS